ncbi:retinoic acid receptor responder protein 2-like [Latimeria chalumnae]|uniref:retinoic acid receptor responder protein 2-like n=1 Tax=Latimeria chalumnae TaxID=7897 RepID=UPI00313D86A2
MKGWYLTFLAITIAIVATSAQDANCQDSQRKAAALDSAMSKFNQNTHFGFKVYSVEECKETKNDTGSFLQLKYTLKQTTCKKAAFKKDKDQCPFKNNGRVAKCSTNFKVQNDSLDPDFYVNCDFERKKVSPPQPPLTGAFTPFLEYEDLGSGDIY